MQPVSTILPAVRNTRGHSNDAQNFLQMSGSKNSAKLAEMRNAAMRVADFEESQGQNAINQQRYVSSFKNTRTRG